MLIAFALLHLITAASCSTKSTLGKPETPCVVSVNKFEVHYGYNKGADTASFCAINKKYPNGFVGFGPATEMTDSEGIVVVGDTFKDSTRQKAWKISSLPLNAEEAKGFFTAAPVHEVDGTEHRVCFTIKTEKLRGSVELSRFVWTTGKQKQLGNHQGTGDDQGRIPLNLEKARSDGQTEAPKGQTETPKDQPEAPKEISCATKSTLGKDHLPCMTIARGIEIHFGLKNDDASLCAINTGYEEGWVGLGPGKAMDGSSVVIGEGPSGELKQRPVKLESWDVSKDKPEDFVSGDIQHSIPEKKRRMICYTMKVTKLNGSPTEANFVWAAGETASVSKHRLSNAGMMTIDFESGSAKGTSGGAPILVLLHVTCMALAFLIFYPAGVIIAVYSGPGFSKGPIYFKMHKALMLVATAIALVGFALIMIHTDITFSHAHGFLGSLVLFFCIAQPINAHFRVAKGHPQRRVWEYLHKGIGRIAVFGGLIVCILGAMLYGEKGIAGESVTLVLLVFTVLLANVAFWTWAVLRFQQKKVTASQLQITPQPETNGAKKTDDKVKSPKKAKMGATKTAAARATLRANELANELAKEKKKEKKEKKEKEKTKAKKENAKEKDDDNDKEKEKKKLVPARTKEM
eukprot:GEMP01020522.1.p1 GENE.GEMP01020522.1~~GEMP01020522.1.p1  ORF type:complete len:631 (+),score=152.64 GEMP01020522.1:183-2075(+)